MQHSTTVADSGSVATDPVCGMTVGMDSPFFGEHIGKKYFFCCAGCRDRFAREPERYSSKKDAPSRALPIAARAGHVTECPPCYESAIEAPVSSGQQWTCPMHPEVRRAEPGSCPRCGMALEPTVASKAEDTTELDDMSRRLRVAALLAVPLIVVSMADGASGRIGLSRGTGQLIELALSTVLCGWAGAPLLARGVASVKHRSPNMFTLIALGVAASYLYSLVATLAPGLFPATSRGPGGLVPVYFEAAGVIVTLVLLGQVLELGARRRTGLALRSLLELAPERAFRVRDGAPDEEISLHNVNVGDRLRVRPGDRVPADGVVLEGRSTVDESMVTGEPVPVEKTISDAVIGGTTNGLGSFVLRAEKVGEETLLSQIVKLVAAAQRSRAPVQRLADRIASYFVPGVILCAAGTFVAWSIAGPEPRLAHALISAVSVLIIACPCALGLATPMSILVATGRAATEGVLFRDAEALERLGSVDTLVVDKTGTLTEGKPEVVRVDVEPGEMEADVIRIAASLEAVSEHPLASAVLALAKSRSVAGSPVSDFEYVPGQGVRGTVGGESVAIGNHAMMEREAVVAGSIRAEDASRTPLYVARHRRLAGVLFVEDPIKATTPDALRALDADGVHVVMLTGDTVESAAAVAKRLGITDVVAAARPERKLETVERLEREGRKVAMAGDGVNDAPALARAAVGIAMGTGTNVAIESAGVTLVKGDLRGIVRARRLSRQTMTNVRQNLVFAFGYNAIGIPVAAGALHPLSGIVLSPMFAAAAMSFSSVSVIANALRLRRR